MNSFAHSLSTVARPLAQPPAQRNTATACPSSARPSTDRPTIFLVLLDSTPPASHSARCEFSIVGLLRPFASPRLHPRLMSSPEGARRQARWDTTPGRQTPGRQTRRHRLGTRRAAHARSRAGHNASRQAPLARSLIHSCRCTLCCSSLTPQHFFAQRPAGLLVVECAALRCDETR